MQKKNRFKRKSLPPKITPTTTRKSMLRLTTAKALNQLRLLFKNLLLVLWFLNLKFKSFLKKMLK